MLEGGAEAAGGEAQPLYTLDDLLLPDEPQLLLLSQGTPAGGPERVIPTGDACCHVFREGRGQLGDQGSEFSCWQRHR